jgi:hypothetical protein
MKNEDLNILGYSEFLNEKKPADAPDWHDSDAPDAEGRFRDLGIKDLAAWLIKTRNKDVKKISGSLTQQIVFNRKEDPEYADKMEKVRKEVYKQLGREDLLEAKYSGYLSGDVAEDIAKELSYYVKGIIEQPNSNYTYLHLKNKSDISKVIKTLKDVYGLDGTDGGKLFWPSPTVKFDNDRVIEAIDEDAKIDLGGAEPLEVKDLKGGVSLVQKSKIGSGKNVVVVPQEHIKELIEELKKYM